MPLFEHIRPYLDEEVQSAISKNKHHPIFTALCNFTFPSSSKDEIETVLRNCHSIRDFQTKVIYYSIKNILHKSSKGLTTAGFEGLKKDSAYLFLSNHRDIILDTSLINMALFEHDLVMAASAIGDNLIDNPVLKDLARLNRSFIVQRNLTPREMLVTSKKLSFYIQTQIVNTRSIWIAQGEGRTKDGNDRTQQGLLKMLSMSKGKLSSMEYLKSLRIRPTAISYELDPTDMLKIPALIAKEENKEYIKSADEDFNNIIKGVLGDKNRIHIEVCAIENAVFDKIDALHIPENDKLKKLVAHIDVLIHQHYKLRPFNYLAYDLLHTTTKYNTKYTAADKVTFETRIKNGNKNNDQRVLKNILLMYANPVVNQLTVAGVDVR